MRASGILMPVFSLPGPFGIGTLGKEAFAFVDFLAEAKQTYWQILPIGPTGYGDSPYQSFSAFAGNPYFIDYRLLADTLADDGHVFVDADFFTLLRREFDTPSGIDSNRLRTRVEILVQSDVLLAARVIAPLFAIEERIHPLVVRFI